MQRKFISNLAFLIFLNLLIKPFWIFGIDRTVQNTVGAEDYGIYFALFNFTYLFNMILDFGVNNFNNRAISRERDRLDTYFSRLIAFKAILSVLYILVAFGVGWLIGFDAFQFELLAFLAANQILLSVILYFRSNVAALQLFRLDAILSVLDRTFVILFCSVLLWGNVIPGTFRIEWFVYAQSAALLLTAVIAFFATLRNVSTFRLTFDWPFIKRIAMQSYPFALLGLLMAVYNRIDAVMIERLLPATGKTESGIYAASYRLLDAVNMIPFLFTTILLPLFSRMIKQNEQIGGLLELAVKLMLSIAIVLSIACYVYQHEIMQLLYPATTEYWSVIFGLLILSFNAIALIFIYGSLLTANGSLKYLNRIALAGLVANIGLNWFLIPGYGALGATLSTIATQVGVGLAHVIVAHRIMRVKGNIRMVVALGLLAMVMVGAGWFIPQQIGSWYLGFLLLLSIGVGGAFLFRLVQPGSLAAILNMKREGDAS